MKRFRLKKDLPTFEKGCLFEINSNSDLIFVETASGCRIKTMNAVVYNAEQLRRFPNILTEWFEEIQEPWELKEGDECWVIEMSACGPVASKTYWHNRLEGLRSLGLISLTKNDAESDISRRLAKQILLNDTNGFRRDVYNREQEALFVQYDGFNKRLDHQYEFQMTTGSHIYFGNIEDLRASVKNHKKEWKIYLGVEDE